MSSGGATTRTERGLTSGQREVLRLTCLGLTSVQIAEMFGITAGRVRGKRHIVYQKLHVTNRADAGSALEHLG